MPQNGSNIRAGSNTSSYPEAPRSKLELQIEWRFSWNYSDT